MKELFNYIFKHPGKAGVYAGIISVTILLLQLMIDMIYLDQL